MKSLILPPLSAVYGAIIRARTALYERGTFQTSRLEKSVISVGNITTGGTGKTPLVELIARMLAAEGKTVCILTRGYGRENPRQHVLVSDGTTVFSNPGEAGDEPYLLAKNLQGFAAVISDADRFTAGEGAIKHLSTDCFVMDDGFQHLRLARDLDIVTIDATNPWGDGRLLPHGRLREPLSGLKRAHCFVLTRCEQVDNTEPIEFELARLSGDRPIFRARLHTSLITELNGPSTTTIPAKPVGAFCAVGNPRSFFTHLRNSGYEPIFHQSFPDHHVYSQQDIDRLEARAQQAGVRSLITTTKDAVKLHSLKFRIPGYSLEVQMQIDEHEEFRRLLLSAAQTSDRPE